MEDIKPQSGLVAYLDILGYTNLLKANAPEEVLGRVVKIIDSLPGKVQSYLAKIWSDAGRHSVPSAFPRITSVAFSDSILLTLESGPTSTDAERPLTQPANVQTMIEWVDFLIYVSLLWGELFAVGLPSRGSVARGKFVVRNTAFAGACIVEAYEQAHALDLAAVVLSPSAQSAFSDISAGEAGAQIAANLVVRAQIPIRYGDRRDAVLLEPLIPGRISGLQDIREYVASKFPAWKKDLDAGAITKLTNTEMFFRLYAAREREKKEPPKSEKA